MFHCVSHQKTAPGWFWVGRSFGQNDGEKRCHLDALSLFCHLDALSCHLDALSCHLDSSLFVILTEGKDPHNGYITMDISPTAQYDEVG